MKVEKVDIPIPKPPQEVRITLTLEEAMILSKVLGASDGNDSNTKYSIIYNLFDKLDDLVGQDKDLKCGGYTVK